MWENIVSHFRDGTLKLFFPVSLLFFRFFPDLERECWPFQRFLSDPSVHRTTKNVKSTFSKMKLIEKSETNNSITVFDVAGWNCTNINIGCTFINKRGQYKKLMSNVFYDTIAYNGSCLQYSFIIAIYYNKKLKMSNKFIIFNSSFLKKQFVNFNKFNNMFLVDFLLRFFALKNLLTGFYELSVTWYRLSSFIIKIQPQKNLIRNNKNDSTKFYNVF